MAERAEIGVENKNKFFELLKQNKVIFCETQGGLIVIRIHIFMRDPTPFAKRSYPIVTAQKQEARRQINEKLGSSDQKGIGCCLYQMDGESNHRNVVAYYSRRLKISKI